MGVVPVVRRVGVGDFRRFRAVGVAAVNVAAGRVLYRGKRGVGRVVSSSKPRPSVVREVRGRVSVSPVRESVRPVVKSPVVERPVVEEKAVVSPVVKPVGKPGPVVKSPVVRPVVRPVRRGGVVSRRRSVRAVGGSGRGVGRGVSSAARVRELLVGRGVGRFLVVVACGPSVGEVDFGGVGEHGMIDVMCVNKPFLPLWPSEFWLFCDHSQYRRNVGAWDGFGSGLIFNSTNVKVRRSNQLVFRARPGRGFSLDVSEGFFIGRSSSYAAMQVCAFMGYDRVFLFGVDMCAVGGRLHHYGVNPDVSDVNRVRRFAAEAESFEWAGRNLSEGVRRRFFFCSGYNSWPFTRFFNRWDHVGAVGRILELASGLG